MSLFQVSAFAVFERSLERTTVTFSFNGAASANRIAHDLIVCRVIDVRARQREEGARVNSNRANGRFPSGE